MILFVEGPRGCGKTFLINQFLEECRDSRLEYYKFYFADHVKALNLTKNDSDPSLHYFSLGNIMTILEMNQRPQYADKIWIFDRAIMSAYAWATLRGRLELEEAGIEYMKIIESNLFKNCKTLYVTVDRQTGDSARVKDTWDGAHSTQIEIDQLSHFFGLGFDIIGSSERGNDGTIIRNNFDQSSIELFKSACYQLLGIKPNK
jgi:thymidylate kinase